MLAEEPDNLAAETLAEDDRPDDADVETDPVPDVAVVDAVDDAVFDDTSVPDEGLLSMKPWEGVLLGVLCEDAVEEATALDDDGVAVVEDETGLDARVNVCVVAYVPPRSPLIVLNAIAPATSAHSSTVTVKVESSAEDTAVPCRLCIPRW